MVGGSAHPKDFAVRPFYMALYVHDPFAHRSPNSVPNEHWSMKWKVKHRSKHRDGTWRQVGAEAYKKRNFNLKQVLRSKLKRLARRQKTEKVNKKAATEKGKQLTCKTKLG